MSLPPAQDFIVGWPADTPAQWFDAIKTCRIEQWRFLSCTKGVYRMPKESGEGFRQSGVNIMTFRFGSVFILTLRSAVPQSGRLRAVP